MGDRDLIRVVDVDYIKDYTMDLKVSNGETRCVDFLPLFKKAFPGDVFLRLMVSFMVCGKATSLYAFSGMGDRIAHAEINIFAAGLVVFVTQLFCYVVLKKVKHKKVFAIKKMLVKYGNRISKRSWIKGVLVWIMTTCILATYLMQLLVPLLFFMVIWAPIVLIVYSVVVLRSKWRRKLLTGHKSLIKLLSVFTQQCLGYILFLLIGSTPLLHFINYNPYPSAYEMDFREYVDVMGGLEQMAVGMLVWGFFFVIPWGILGISKIVHTYKTHSLSTRGVR